ncbi:hypothetical protein BMF94_2657 [Rhodotorula taiwanensis]|uniref:CDP-diacylglycerol--glycerol-3-phosphate 1-phosphatidyltransferase n=1 Tax=Rhodotorula taiwanensis TaxID=741276 RepID=A0A2S5BBR3_9BASI|nr:hypothetical protein BMF94_2657 [Rhodotorula taiwanensis]
MDQLLRPTRHLLHVARACSPRTQVPTCRRLVSTARCSPQPVPRSLQLHASWPSARHIPIANLARRAFATRPPTPSSPTSTASSSPPPSPPPSSPAPTPDPATSQITAAAATKERHENIYTIPNALTVARIIACPAIGYYILKGDLATATGLLFVAGVSDLADGWLARRFGMGTVLGSILDPAADKLLMTTMVVTLAMKDMLPLPLAIIILGRDVALSISAFYFRYASLPPPKTFTRYWDFSIPSASVHPTQISKYNTFLQLVLVGVTTVAPLLPFDLSTPLWALQWIVAGTTIASGLSYVGAGSSSAIKYLK